MPNADALVAKYAAEDSAGADPANESPSAPPAGGSLAGSAPADVEAPGHAGPPASSGATIDHDELRAKLDADRHRQRAKGLRRQAKLTVEAATKTKAEADAELAKWKAIGKDKSFLDALKEAGHDPRVVYEQMRKEALTAGTPEAQLEAMRKELADLKADREKEKEESKAAAEEREKREAARAQEAQFESDFRKAAEIPKFASLLEEYTPTQLYRIADQLYKNEQALFAEARRLNVRLTSTKGDFTMLDIFSVMHASQAAHEAARMQRRNQGAAPPASETPTQGSAAKTTVNGTEERKAESPVVIGNDLSTTRASEREKLKGMSKEERLEYLKNKYPD